eukprot:303226-Chlamydomonas_euryale.AAC.1
MAAALPPAPPPHPPLARANTAATLCSPTPTLAPFSPHTPTPTPSFPSRQSAARRATWLPSFSATTRRTRRRRTCGRSAACCTSARWGARPS